MFLGGFCGMQRDLGGCHFLSGLGFSGEEGDSILLFGWVLLGNVFGLVNQIVILVQ
jgi:hypothetical protein